jgi:hypothetical protein
MTLTAAQIIEAASAAMVSRFPRIFTPTPNALASVAYSDRGKLCENPKLTVSHLPANGDLRRTGLVTQFRMPSDAADKR